MLGLTQYYPLFFTATNLQWEHLLRMDKYKDIITGSLSFLVKEKRASVYSFVIMSNHLHLIWHIAEGHTRDEVQKDFLKYTSQKIKADLKKYHPLVLEKFKVNAKDREYQIWERNPLSVEIFSEKVLIQKLNYIHQNPVRAKLCKEPLDYKYSSARFYEKGKDEWDFLAHYLG